jgi:hypothetical protein
VTPPAVTRQSYPSRVGMGIIGAPFRGEIHGVGRGEDQDAPAGGRDRPAAMKTLQERRSAVNQLDGQRVGVVEEVWPRVWGERG